MDGESEPSGNEQFSLLLKEHVAPSLKRQGFRRKGQTFRRRSGRNWLVVNLQRSQYSGPGETVYTVNLGVASGRITEFFGGDPEREPAEADCHFRERLGPLLNEGRDHWWTLDRETSFSDVPGTKLARRLEETGVPFLERHAEDEAIRDAWVASRTARGLYWRELWVLLRILGPPDVLADVIAEQKQRYKFNEGKLREIAGYEARLAALPDLIT